MKTAEVIIRDAWQGIYDDRSGGFAEAVIAGLGDEAESIDELQAALRRFMACDDGPGS